MLYIYRCKDAHAQLFYNYPVAFSNCQLCIPNAQTMHTSFESAIFGLGVRVRVLVQLDARIEQFLCASFASSYCMCLLNYMSIRRSSLTRALSELGKIFRTIENT